MKIGLFYFSVIFIMLTGLACNAGQDKNRATAAHLKDFAAAMRELPAEVYVFTRSVAPVPDTAWVAAAGKADAQQYYASFQQAMEELSCKGLLLFKKQAGYKDGYFFMSNAFEELELNSVRFAKVWQPLSDTREILDQAMTELPSGIWLFSRAMETLPDGAYILKKAMIELPDNRSRFEKAMQELPDGITIMSNAFKSLSDQ